MVKSNHLQKTDEAFEYSLVIISTIKRGVDVQVCVECRCLGLCVWNASGGEHGLRAQKELPTPKHALLCIITVH